MKKASYEKFHNAFNAFKKLKESYEFKVRINYTFNKDNFYELADFFKYFDPKSFDILQIRPIQNIGNTEYNNFDISSIANEYPQLIQSIRETCASHNITLMAPNSISNLNSENQSSFIFDYTFCYVSPNKFWKNGFNWREESFNAYSKKIGWSFMLFSNIFRSKKQLKSLSNRLNYEIEFS